VLINGLRKHLMQMIHALESVVTPQPWIKEMDKLM
jgi:hypothetical protein